MTTGTGARHRQIYRHRLLAKRLLAFANRLLPAALSRRVRAMAEQVTLRVVPQYAGDSLSPIFHDWSNRHLRPQLALFGLDCPEDLYFTQAVKIAADKAGAVFVLSLGTGACSLERGMPASQRATQQARTARRCQWPVAYGPGVRGFSRGA